MGSSFPINILFSLLILILVALVISSRFTYLLLRPKAISLSESIKNEIQKGWMNPQAFASLNRISFNITSRFGYQLYGEWIQTGQSMKTIILSHGISSNRYGMIRYLKLFQELGFNIVIYDMRGHGASGGNHVTYGYYEKYDLKSLVDWVIEKHGAQNIIGTMGISLGAAVSLQHAGIDSRIAFIISEASFADLTNLLIYRLKKDYHLPQFPFIPLTGLFCRIISGMDLNQVSPTSSSVLIHSPTLVIHGEADQYIPPKMSLEIFNSLATSQKRLYLATGAGHSHSLSTDPKEYKRQVTSFFDLIKVPY